MVSPSSSPHQWPSGRCWASRLRRAFSIAVSSAAEGATNADAEGGGDREGLAGGRTVPVPGGSMLVATRCSSCCISPLWLCSGCRSRSGGSIGIDEGGFEPPRDASGMPGRRAHYTDLDRDLSGKHETGSAGPVPEGLAGLLRPLPAGLAGGFRGMASRAEWRTLPGGAGRRALSCPRGKTLV